MPALSYDNAIKEIDKARKKGNTLDSLTNLKKLLELYGDALDDLIENAKFKFVKVKNNNKITAKDRNAERDKITALLDSPAGMNTGFHELNIDGVKLTPKKVRDLAKRDSSHADADKTSGDDDVNNNENEEASEDYVFAAVWKFRFAIETYLAEGLNAPDASTQGAANNALAATRKFADAMADAASFLDLAAQNEAAGDDAEIIAEYLVAAVFYGEASRAWTDLGKAFLKANVTAVGNQKTQDYIDDQTQPLDKKQTTADGKAGTFVK